AAPTSLERGSAPSPFPFPVGGWHARSGVSLTRLLSFTCRCRAAPASRRASERSLPRFDPPPPRCGATATTTNLPRPRDRTTLPPRSRGSSRSELRRAPLRSALLCHALLPPNAASGRASPAVSR
uniref:Uncharacterized protein n=1 Tax=Aegilops tauschii subsp. strangulata TaxID=200361 RepID=A0A452Y3W0_AEGTS